MLRSLELRVASCGQNWKVPSVQPAFFEVWLKSCWRRPQKSLLLAAASPPSQPLCLRGWIWLSSGMAATDNPKWKQSLRQLCVLWGRGREGSFVFENYPGELHIKALDHIRDFPLPDPRQTQGSCYRCHQRKADFSGTMLGCQIIGKKKAFMTKKAYTMKHLFL